jgi:hypothetical protein
LSEGQTQVNRPFPGFPDSLLTVAKRLYRAAAQDLPAFGYLLAFADPVCEKRM